MRLLPVVFLGTLTLAGMPHPMPAQGSRDSLAASETMRRFHDALTRGDSATVLSLLADDAVIVEAGAIQTVAEYRAGHLPADMQYAAAVPSKLASQRVTVVGNAAWVSSTSDVVGTTQGRAVNSVTAELAVLSRTPDGWKIRAIHWSSRRRPTQ